MDRFLPQKLQEAAAAATAAKAKAAGTAGKPEQQQPKFAAPKTDKNKERVAVPPSRPSPAASPTVPFKEPVAAAPVSRPYITPMPAGIKPRRAILQQDEAVNGIVGQVVTKGQSPPPGIIDEFGQIEQGMEFLNMDGPLPDDLDAPSSFCCPITTVGALFNQCSVTISWPVAHVIKTYRSFCMCSLLSLWVLHLCVFGYCTGCNFVSHTSRILLRYNCCWMLYLCLFW